MMRLRCRMPGRLPTPTEAAEYPYSEAERHFVDSWLANVVHGSGETVRTGTDESMITMTIADRQARLHSYELLAQAYRLPGSAVHAEARG